MFRSRNRRRLAGVPVLAGVALALAATTHLFPASGEGKVDYNREIRPILAENCYTCHGPDEEKREARLRLDRKEGALAERGRRRPAIVPGDVEKSELVARITAADEDDLMPPPESGKALTPAQIQTLERWIAEGAAWNEHWAFVPPERPPVPDVRDEAWPTNPVDRFVLSRLEREGLAPSPEADRITLYRRLSFDLRGLPPTPGEVDSFLRDGDANAYEKAVDRLLGSPHYGERMAIFWLDLVRFADTRGYHSDNPRNVSPYRDYVIRAFNENKPFDRFTIEQLAGDLLPEPTLEQLVASCYNKLNQTTEEGGAQAREYEAKTAADRVRNVSSVWMGATLGCAECHDHKFDPYRSRDFYSLAAFFADIQEPAIMDRDQGIPVPTPGLEEKLRSVEDRIAAARARIENPPPALAARIASDQAEWEARVAREIVPRFGPWFAVGPFSASSHSEAFRTAFAPEKGVDLSAAYRDGTLRWREERSWEDGKVHELRGDNAATYLYRTVTVEAESFLGLSLGSDDGIRLWVNGEEVLSRDVSRGVAPDQEKIKVTLGAGTNHLLMKITNGSGGYAFYFRPVGADGVPEPIRAVVRTAAGDRTPAQEQELAKYYRSIAPALETARAELKRLEAEKTELDKSVPRCLVSAAGKPRVVRVLPRGNWMDTSGDVVDPAIPACFGKLETDGERATRLDLARWMVSARNPLTARVFVNRLWKLFFGTGLSRRLEDLGAMGEPPVHPELLDWLAVEFVESGWNVKDTVKLLLMSSTYRQTSRATGAQLERDPYNRLLARQSRWRLDAEMVRDNALAVSGLLARDIGGPSVKPYQPEGYWVHLNFPKRRWVADRGRDAYRRGLYTWWQRSFLHPSLMAFDAPSREECTAERPRSNIPQQALVLLNDPTYVEAARALAYRMIEEGGEMPEDRVRRGFRRVLSRHPDEGEIAVLVGLYREHVSLYAEDTAAARELVSVGQSPTPDDMALAELAAWTSVARAILNLHETVTRN